MGSQHILREAIGKTPLVHNEQEDWELVLTGCYMAKVTVNAEISRQGKNWYFQTLAAKYSGTEVEYILQNTGVKIYVDWDVFAQLSEY